MVSRTCNTSAGEADRIVSGLTGELPKVTLDVSLWPPYTIPNTHMSTHTLVSENT